MPASFAAASTSGASLPSGAGTTITSRGTPATLAGTGFISTGDVEADRVDRAPARSKLDPQRIDEALVGRELAAVIGHDPIAREGERIERPTVAGRIGRIDLIGPHAQAGLVEIDAVQFPAEL